MVSWLIVLCLSVIALWRAAPPPMAVVAARSATGVVTYSAVPTVRAEGDGLREDAGLPDNPDQRDDAQVGDAAGAAVQEPARVGGDAAGCDGRSGRSGGGSGYLTVANISPD